MHLSAPGAVALSEQKYIGFIHPELRLGYLARGVFKALGLARPPVSLQYFAIIPELNHRHFSGDQVLGNNSVNLCMHAIGSELSASGVPYMAATVYTCDSLDRF